MNKHGIDSLLIDVYNEFCSATAHHRPMNSPHEAYSVILEEIDEYWDEVRKKSRDRNSQRMKEELIQAAAMCLRAIIDTCPT